LVVDYVNGFALAEAAHPIEQLEGRSDLLALLHTRPTDRFPVMRRVLGGLRDDELGADFGFGLDVILAGLDTLVDHGSGPLLDARSAPSSPSARER
jgi:hypothetical protein